METRAALTGIDDASTEYQGALERLLAASTPDEIADALQDAVEALRHIAYHLADPPYLREMLEAQLASMRDAESLGHHSRTLAQPDALRPDVAADRALRAE